MAKSTSILMLLLTCLLATAQQPLLNEVYEDYEGNTAWSIVADDEGYILAGNGWSDLVNDYTAIKLMRVDEFGFLIWKKIYGSIGSGYYTGGPGAFIKLSISNGFVSFGSKNTSGKNIGLIVKYNEFGDTLWSRAYSGIRDYIFYHGIELENGDLVGTGYTNSIGNADGDMWLVVLDSTGQEKWQKTYGGLGFDVSRIVIQTIDKGFAISGATDSYGQGSWDAFLVKTDSIGNLEWEKTYGTDWKEYSAKITLTSLGGYYLWGEAQDEDLTTGFPTYEKTTYIKKLSENGDVLWTKTIRQDNTHWAYINQLKEVDNGDNIVLVGHYQDYSDDQSKLMLYGWVCKLDSSGNKLWERYYSNPNNFELGAYLNDFQYTLNSKIACTGVGNTPGTIFANQQNFWLLVLDSMGCLVPGCDTITGISETALTQPMGAAVYPNPNVGNITIAMPQMDGGEYNFTMFNLLGQQVFNSQLTNTRTTLSHNLPSSIYVYQITHQGQVQTGKLLVE